MFEINLLYEQQEFQRQKDFDPVRLTVMGGILILLGIGLWTGVLYLKMGPLRTELNGYQTTFDNRTNDYANLIRLTGNKEIPLEKIKEQAEALRTRQDYRILMGTVLDVFRDTMPTNCQIQSLRTLRSMAVISRTKKIPDKENPGKMKDANDDKKGPALLLVFDVITRGTTSVEVHSMRDKLEEQFHREPRLREWVRQVPDGTRTNNWNDFKSNGLVHEPRAGSDSTDQASEPYIGEFEFKMPFALKDPLKDL